MDKTSNKKNNFDKSDPFTSGMAFWQNYISNLFSVYTQFIDDIQKMNQIYRESAEITKEMGTLYKELAVHIEKMNQLYRESAEITDRMNKYWLENIWKPFLLYKEQNEKKKKKKRKM